VKEALAMGGDRGCLVVAEPDPHDSLTIAYLLARAVERFGPFDLLLCAEGSSDIYAGRSADAVRVARTSIPGLREKIEVKDRVISCEQTWRTGYESWKQSCPSSSQS